jgi:hypothetical protein
VLCFFKDILLSEPFFCIKDFFLLIEGDIDIDFDFSKAFSLSNCGDGLPLGNRCLVLDLASGDYSKELFSDYISAHDSVNCYKSAAFLTGLKDSKYFSYSMAIFSFFSLWNCLICLINAILSVMVLSIFSIILWLNFKFFHQLKISNANI